MHIARLDKFSTRDYPGKMSCIIYTAGCNFNCWSCPHREFIPEDCAQIPEDEVTDFLERRNGMIEVVIIDGGEPTLQSDLREFIRSCRRLGYDVMLRTNGSNPREVSTILSERLLTRGQVYFKAPVSKYRQLCGFHGEAVPETIEAMRRARLSFDVVTQVVPELTERDIEQMSREAGQVPNWILQVMPDLEGADPDAVDKSKKLAPSLADMLRRTQESVEIDG